MSNTIGIDGIKYKEHIDTSIPEKGVRTLPFDKTDIMINLLKDIKDAISFLGQSERTTYYDNSGTSTVATTDILQIGSPLYTREKIYYTIGRKAEKIYVINRGQGRLYIRVSYKEGEVFTDEIVVREGEYIILNNVYELRHRSNTSGLSYRITEHDISLQTVVSKAEEIEIINTDKDIHFTETITINNQEKENITGLLGNKYLIRGVNVQSDQQLKYRLIFWGKDTFDDTDLDINSYIDDVELDFTSTSAFQIGSTGQYYLNVGSLDILYEDADNTKELHISLQNLSAVSKNSGSTGEVQLDIKMSPRL